MSSSTARPAVAALSRLGQATAKRNQATHTSQISADFAAMPPFLKSRPFERAPWNRPNSTKGTIRFLGPTKDGKDAFLNFKKGEGHQTNFGPSLERVVDITDLRTLEPKTTIRTEGVEWVHEPSVLSEDKLLAEKDEMEAFVRGPYFDECAALVKERTGAAKAIAYNFRHRRIEVNTNLLDPYKFSNKPLPNFHMDNDSATAEINLRRVLGDEEAERNWLGKRWGIVNVWRPVGDVVRQWPLALVDSRTVRYGRDTVPIYTKNNYKTHFTALKPQEHFDFYYVSDLAPDEALLFVDYDSANEGNGSVVGMAHGAFEDHNALRKVPRRRSIEVRCLVLYDD